MSDMPRPRPPHLHCQRTRHGVVTWYVRIGHGKRTRIRGEYGSAPFMAAYHAAITGEIVEAPKTRAGTVEWLILRYMETTAWADLSSATRKQRSAIFRQIVAKVGKEPIGQITKASVVKSRDARRETPAQARNFLDALRGLFRWAHEAGHVATDPTVGVGNPKRPKGAGFAMWTDEEVDRYQARWPLGTRERVAIDLLLYTGLRRGDAVVLGRQHVKNGVATIRTEKTGTPVVIPILPVLAATLAAGPTGDLTFIAGERGRPMVKESFGTWFRIACRAAGVTKSAHGLRKAGATRAAEQGATVAELEAIFGWEGGGMASLYTRAANRSRLAAQAMKKLER